MGSISEQSHYGCEKAESIGLLHQLQTFSFILLLWVFDDILGITKILSDTLQDKELDLARAMELVNSVQETLTEQRSQAYSLTKTFHNIQTVVMLTSLVIRKSISALCT